MDDNEEIKLISRGTEKINLADLEESIDLKFPVFLELGGFKDKQKKELQELLPQFVKALENKEIVYNRGGGFTNYTNLSSKDNKKFDALGYIAGFVGQLIRTSHKYVPDTSSKIEWGGNSTVGDYVLNKIFGDENRNYSSFIDLDLPENGVRSTKNRMQELWTPLSYAHDNFDDLFTSITPIQKKEWMDYYEKAKKALENGELDANEYLYLERLLGLDNLRDLFYTGDKYPFDEQDRVKPEAENDSNPYIINGQVNEQALYSDLLKLHPKSTVTNFKTYSLTSEHTYSQDLTNKLSKVLAKASTKDLINLIGLSLTKGSDNKVNEQLKKLSKSTSTPKFDKTFVLKVTLETLRTQNKLGRFDENSNDYYIPITHPKLDERSSGLVYHIDPNGNHYIQEMDRWEIPYYVNKWTEELIPSNKKGGILKAIDGVNTNDIQNNITFTDNYDWNQQFYPTIQEKLLEQFENIKNDTTLTDSEKQSKYKELVNNINKVQELHYELSTAWNNGKTVLTDENNVNKTKQLQDLIRNHFGFVNDLIDKNNQYYKYNYKNGSPKTHQDSKKGNWASDGLFQGYTASRWLLGNTTPDTNDDFYKKLNEYGISRVNKTDYGTHNFLEFSVDNNEPVSNGDSDSSENGTQPQVEGTGVEGTRSQVESPESQVEEEPFVDNYHTGDLSTLWEKYINTDAKVDYKGKWWKELMPEFLRASELATHLIGGDNAYKEMLKGLKPAQVGTWWVNRPLLGDLATYQYQNNLANELLYKFKEPFTSDADKATDRMYAGYQQASDYRTKARLAFNQGVLNSLEKQFTENKDYLGRVSDTHNKNVALRTENNTQIAKLKATRIKNRTENEANYLNDSYTILSKKLNDKSKLYDSAREQLIASNLQRWYDSKMEAADVAKADYKGDDITKWNGYDNYIWYSNLISDMMKAKQEEELNKIYGFKFTNPYSEDLYDKINWS